MMNYTEFCKQRNRHLPVCLGPIEFLRDYLLHQALALGCICSGRGEDSQSWSRSFRATWLGLMRARAGVSELLSDDEQGGNELLLSYFLQVYFTPYVPQIGKIGCQGKDMEPVETTHSLAALHGVTSTPHSPPAGSVVQRGEEMRWKRGRKGSLTDVEQFPQGKAVASISAY